MEGLRAQRAMLTSHTRINEWLEEVLSGIEVALLEQRERTFIVEAPRISGGRSLSKNSIRRTAWSEEKKDVAIGVKTADLELLLAS